MTQGELSHGKSLPSVLPWMLEMLYRKMRNVCFLLLSFQKKILYVRYHPLERVALSSTVWHALTYPDDKQYQSFTESPGSLADCCKLLIVSSEFRNILSFLSSLWERKTEILISRVKRSIKQPSSTMTHKLLLILN